MRSQLALPAESAAAGTVDLAAVAERAALRAERAVDAAGRAVGTASVHGDQLQQRDDRAVGGEIGGAGDGHRVQTGRKHAGDRRAGGKQLSAGVSGRVPADFRGRTHEGVGAAESPLDHRGRVEPATDRCGVIERRSALLRAGRAFGVGGAREHEPSRRSHLSGSPGARAEQSARAVPRGRLWRSQLPRVQSGAEQLAGRTVDAGAQRDAVQSDAGYDANGRRIAGS